MKQEDVRSRKGNSNVRELMSDQKIGVRETKVYSGPGRQSVYIATE